MKLSTLAASLVAASITATTAGAQGAPASPAPSAATPAPTDPTLKDPKAQVSYAIGYNIGRQMKSDGVSVDGEVLAHGIRDGQAGATAAIAPEQMNAAMTSVQTTIMEHRHQAEAAQADQNKQLAETNKTAGEAFLKANAAKPGVVTTASGLQYEILVKGTGPTPKAEDTVVCNYRGTLVDGTEFDSSASHGGPATFPVRGVIKGWTEALQMMPVGSKWRLVLPADLAYGPNGAGSQIGPNAVLVFEVELVSIKSN